MMRKCGQCRTAQGSAEQRRPAQHKTYSTVKDIVTQDSAHLNRPVQDNSEQRAAGKNSTVHAIVKQDNAVQNSVWQGSTTQRNVMQHRAVQCAG